MKFKFITPSHASYRDELMLRWEVLRKPLGMPPGSEVLPEEMECLHLIAIEDKKLVGCVLFHPESEHSGRVLQLALSEEYRGKGGGRKLVSNLEQALAKRGVSDLYLFAREDLIGFYERLGYHLEGESFERMGVPHRIMKKTQLVDALRSA